MATAKDFDNPVRPTWCSGCGNYAIWNGVKRALAQAGLEPHQVMLVGGIGCSSKLPDYTRANGFTSLHGRPIPIAHGIKLANHDLTVIVSAGDGDTYGLGLSHLINALRRNAGLTIMVHNNRIYGLTKGQYSPTSPVGFRTKTSPAGSLDAPINPIALALAVGGTFVARAFSGDLAHLVDVLTRAFTHRGCALVDILQPCVTFNPGFSYDYYRPRVYRLEEAGHDPTDFAAAWRLAQSEWGERIPIGVFRQVQQPTYEERLPVLSAGGPLVKQMRLWDEAAYAPLLEQFI